MDIYFDLREEFKKKTGHLFNERNTEARLRNHCCRGKTVRITNSERVSVALFIQHVKLMRHTVS
jgi:hypothetical protein